MPTLGNAVSQVAGGVGGWLILLAWALVIAVMPQADCTPGDDLMWRGTAIFGVVAALGGLLCGTGVRLRAQLKWLAAAAAPLIAMNLYWLLPALFSTTLGDQSLCAASTLEPTSWERAWPVVQTTTACIAALQVVRYWRPANATSEPGPQA